jgi:hypothetical protein
MNTIKREKLIRADAFPVRIYNDGLTVLLYDAAHEDRIRQTNPLIVWYACTASCDDAATRELTETGILLVYGLHGDDCLNLDVAGGDRLSETELAAAVWHEPREGFLHLPSGRLEIHSYNTLPMGDNGDDPPDEGSSVEVPPGFYRVTLSRVDREETLAAGKDYDAEWADEVIVLTPVEELARSPNILFRECLE